MNKGIKIAIIITSIVLVLVIVAGFVVGNVFYNLALNPHSDKSSVTGAEHNAIDYADTDERRASREAVAAWLESVAMDDVYLTSGDGLRLHGSAIRQEKSQWAILCHGYTGNSTQMASSGMRFYNEGYNLLMPDARGHGESEGDYIGMGWDDRLDVVGWIHWIVEQDPDAQIVLYGVSMGGATVMMVSGEALPANVKAIVEDCGYSSIWGEFSYQLNMLFGLPAFPVMHFSSLVTRMRAGYWLGAGDAVAQVAKSVTPMLFIHGSADTFVPAAMLDEVYAAASVPKERILVEGAGHGGAASVMGAPYWEAVFAFVGQYVD